MLIYWNCMYAFLVDVQLLTNHSSQMPVLLISPNYRVSWISFPLEVTIRVAFTDWARYAGTQNWLNSAFQHEGALPLNRWLFCCNRLSKQCTPAALLWIYVAFPGWYVQSNYGLCLLKERRCCMYNFVYMLCIRFGIHHVICRSNFRGPFHFWTSRRSLASGSSCKSDFDNEVCCYA